jgi:uncharacterized metal-binding protein
MYQSQLCGSCGADKMWVFPHLVTKMSDRILEQQINIKFCIKLTKNSSDTCEMLSKDYEQEDMKRASVSEWHKQFKESSHVKITNEDNAHYFL